jgi:excisionase family DNA binding protein
MAGFEPLGVCRGYARINDNSTDAGRPGGRSAPSAGAGRLVSQRQRQDELVYEAVRAGRLPCHRVGRHIRFTRPMLDNWLAEQPRQ